LDSMCCDAATFPGLIDPAAQSPVKFKGLGEPGRQCASSW
jgi:hypothetical protein